MKSGEKHDAGAKRGEDREAALSFVGFYGLVFSRQSAFEGQYAERVQGVRGNGDVHKKRPPSRKRDWEPRILKGGGRERLSFVTTTDPRNTDHLDFAVALSLFLPAVPLASVFLMLFIATTFSLLAFEPFCLIA